MRILHYMAGLNVGGVQSMVYDLIHYTVKQGHKVDIASIYNGDHVDDSDYKFGSLGCGIIKSGSANRYSYKHARDLAKLMRNYDVVHIHLFPQQFHASMAYRLLNHRDRPVLVTTEHSTWNNRRDKGVLKYFDRWMYGVYDKIVCISPKTEENLNEWLDSKRLKSRMVTVTNGIDLERFAGATDRLKDFVKDYNPENKYVVMVSRMTAPKDPVTVVKALALCQENVHAVFVGSGPLLKDIEATASDEGLSERVHILGAQRDVSGIIKGCDIGVLSTHWDGFGLSAAEGMAAGVPMIGCDVDGLRDVIGNKDLCFPVGDYEKLAGIITSLLSSNEYYESMKKRGEEHVQQFSSTVMGEKYLKIYSDLILEKERKSGRKQN